MMHASMTDAAGRRQSKRRIPFFSSRAKSPGADSSFSASQILPRSNIPNVASAFNPPPELPGMPSTRPSTAQASVFDPIEGEIPDDYHTEPTTAPNSGSGDDREYDLKPPPPSMPPNNVEALAVRFFSADHLNLILRDHSLFSRFKRFVTQYKPYALPSLESYLDMQKAVTAIEYANALADALPSLTGDVPHQAAVLEERFEERSRTVVQELVEDALPGYITHRYVQLVTESLVKEITGNNAPLMREMIPSLAEVYCVTDPSMPDNPIVYASEEFYQTTQYGRDYVIGRNCRFLQGPKSSTATVSRMIEALRAGQEITETILNYRRDGTPFMNLLMIAPLYDNKGNVRYFIGCQIDISHLVEGGRGLESFEQLLAKDRSEERFRGRSMRTPQHVLGELGQMFNDEEIDVVRKRARSFSRDSGASTPVVSGRTPARGGRRILGMEDSAVERNLWPSASLGPSGRLPGVYQNYLLVRPYPSLRITFTSPALRIPGLLQTKFLERIGGPQHVREGVFDSLAHGTSVTAKISWLTNPVAGGDGAGLGSMEGKPRWIHCTPLLGSDDKVGVWMVVMVEEEAVTGALRRGSTAMIDQMPSTPRQAIGPVSPRITTNTNKLYAEYLRREGKSPQTTAGGSTLPSRGSSGRAATEHHPFQDF